MFANVIKRVVTRLLDRIDNTDIFDDEGTYSVFMVETRPWGRTTRGECPKGYELHILDVEGNAVGVTQCEDKGERDERVRDWLVTAYGGSENDYSLAFIN